MSIAAMCRVLAVSRSGYYDWLARARGNPPNGRCQNRRLVTEIKTVHAEFRYYGSPRVHRSCWPAGAEWAGTRSPE